MKYILLWLGLVAVSFVLSLFAEDSPFRKNQKRSPRIIDDDMDVFDSDDQRRRYRREQEEHIRMVNLINEEQQRLFDEQMRLDEQINFQDTWGCGTGLDDNFNNFF